MKQKFILDSYDDETDFLDHREFRTLKEFSDALNGNLTEADLTKYRPDEQEKSALVSAGAFVDESMKPSILPTTIPGAERMDVA